MLYTPTRIPMVETALAIMFVGSVKVFPHAD